MTVRAQGEGFELHKLNMGAKFFVNRPYPLAMVPERFAGFDLLVHSAIKNEVQHCKVTATEKGRIYIAVRRNNVTAADLDGWKPERNSEIRYTTHDKNKPGILYVYYKEAKAGQTIVLPQTKDFAGVTLLAAKIEYEK